MLLSSTVSSEAMVTFDARPCARKRCGQPAAADAELCAGCEAVEKERKRLARKAHVEMCHAKWICVDCPAGSPRKAERFTGKKPKIALCHAHRIKRGKHKTRGVARLVAKWRERTDRLSATTGLVAWKGNEGRVRHRGKGKRGKPKNEDLTLADFDECIKEMVSARAAYAYSQTEEVQQRPRIQRDDAVKAAFARGDMAVGFFNDAKARHRLGPKRDD